MPTRVSADVEAKAFAIAAGDDGLYLDFPRLVTGPLTGQTGTAPGGLTWAVDGAEFEGLTARLRRGTWQASRGTLRRLTLRSADGRLVLEAAEVALPDGAQLSRGPDGLELMAPTARLRGLVLRSAGAVAAPATKVAVQDARTPSPGSTDLRQGGLRFLDGLSGAIGLTVKVQLDLPVVGSRTLDQRLQIPIEEGCLNFRALDRSLDWLEGAFLEIGMHEGRLAVRWGVPIFGGQREIISWALDEDARTLAQFDRIPVRALADFRVAGDRRSTEQVPAKGKGKGVLRALTIDDITISLAMHAPRSVAVGEQGHVLFGGDDSPGLVDLKITGAVGDGARPGSLRGSVGALDVTVADLALGAAGVVSVDRVRLGQVDPVELRLTGFEVAGVSMAIADVEAGGLRLRL